jgi:glycosyltransferase involved in cell wall biosynthesis
MKIALLSYEYPPETGFGGIGTYTWYQARALAKLGHEVHVLAGATHGGRLRAYEHDGVKVFRFRSNAPWLKITRGLNVGRLWWTKNRLENAFHMFCGLRKLRWHYDYDLLEMPECGAEGLLIAGCCSIPAIVRFHSPARLIMKFYDQGVADREMCAFLEKISMRNASALSSCSHFLAAEVREKLRIHRPVNVISNGIDLGLFDSVDQINFRRRFNLPCGCPIILFSGRMEARKGIHLCRKIVATILQRHNVAFVFAGQDLFRHMQDEFLPDFIGKKLKGSFHYLGKLSLAEIRSALRQSDIFLFPSLWENCPYACLEAMAAGKAIVSTDHGGMPELIKDGENGLLAQNQHSESYIAALERLIDDPGFRERLGASARRTIEVGHTDTHIAALSLSYYKTCLSESPLRPTSQGKISVVAGDS